MTALRSRAAYQILIKLVELNYDYRKENLDISKNCLHFFGLSGIAGIVATGFWFGNIIATIFHTTVLIAAVNWGVLGITGKDIVEWIEITLERI